MTNEVISEEGVNLRAHVSKAMRAAWGVAFGAFVGCELLMVLSSGVQMGYGVNSDAEGFGLMGFGEHWFWQCAYSLVAAGFAGAAAGLVSRRCGVGVGISASVPLVFISAITVYLGVTNLAESADTESIRFDISGSRVGVSAVLSFLMPIAAALAGRLGVNSAQSNFDLFDRRSGTWLGVRWYNAIWLYHMATYVVETCAVALVYIERPFWSLELASWLRGGGIMQELLLLIPAGFIAVNLSCIYLGIDGIRRAYRQLSGLDSWVGPVRVAIYGLGMPILARFVVFALRYILAEVLATEGP